MDAFCIFRIVFCILAKNIVLHFVFWPKICFFGLRKHRFLNFKKKSLSIKTAGENFRIFSQNSLPKKLYKGSKSEKRINI